MASRLLRNAGAAPPWIEADKHARTLLERIEQLVRQARQATPLSVARLQRELEAVADEHDDAARALESLAPTPRQCRPLLDRAALRARLGVALGEQDLEA